ncbi:hypothetical protein LXL04_029814 [Taraxacum kok-saghyz]
MISTGLRMISTYRTEDDQHRDKEDNHRGKEECDNQPYQVNNQEDNKDEDDEDLGQLVRRDYIVVTGGVRRLLYVVNREVPAFEWGSWTPLKASTSATASHPMVASACSFGSGPNGVNAINDEFKALTFNETWVFVPKFKEHTGGSLATYKACLVTKCHSQWPGKDCNDTFSLVVKPTNIRTVCLLSCGSLATYKACRALRHL